jgi:hypothetical protein
VDESHPFEYALFDLIRAAAHLAPGRNHRHRQYRQEGPRQAVNRFLAWNTAWRFYAGGRM